MNIIFIAALADALVLAFQGSLAHAAAVAIAATALLLVWNT